MYARATAFRLKPESQAEVAAHLDEIRARIQSLDGIIMSVTMWNEADGHGQTVSVFEDKASADAAAPLAGEIWAALAPHMLEAPMAVGYERVERLAG